MNTIEKQELARRAVAARWRWINGSHWVNGDTDGDADVFADGGESSNYPRFGVIMRGGFFELEDYNPCEPTEPLPDLDDPATQGCAVATIAERNPRKSMADALRDVAYHVGRGLSYPEALVVCLEAGS